jgi:hypothetical protein
MTMQAREIEFEAPIEGNVIRIPERYAEALGDSRPVNARVILTPKRKPTIWDFVGQIKAAGSIEEERESMIEAAVAHAMGEDEETCR